MAIATVNRTLQHLRASGTMDFRDGELIVLKWRELQELGDFNPDYLHMGTAIELTNGVEASLSGA